MSLLISEPLCILPFLLVQNRLRQLVMCGQCQAMLNGMVVKGFKLVGWGWGLKIEFYILLKLNILSHQFVLLDEKSAD